MTVVSDSGPLIHLARAEHFDLLRMLFGRIIIPDAVFVEVCEDGRDQWGDSEVRNAGWVQRLPVPDTREAEAFGADLGPGEVAAIVLARRLPADLVLLDDGNARAAASGLGLNVRGTLGVLAEGYRRGFVSDMELALTRMRDRGTWLHEDLAQHILVELGLR